MSNKLHFVKTLLVLILMMNNTFFYAQVGALDLSFDPNFGGLEPRVHAIAFQPDGKILVGGNFESCNAKPIHRIARLNIDGSLDNTFNSGTGADNDGGPLFSRGVLALALQADGKVIIGGQFSMYNGVFRRGIARINSDGSLDNSFDPIAGLNTGGAVKSIAIQSDGKIILGGSFGAYNYLNRMGVARINPDGSIDPSFDPGTGISGGEVWCLSVQPDGKILMAGKFTSYNGTPVNSIVRLNADGSIDNTFNSGTGANIIIAFSLQSDGKILIGGDFTSYDGTPINHVARINADGSLDKTFNPGTGVSGFVMAITHQSD